MWEPRGHADMYGCIPTDPVTPDGTVGVLFLHNEGFSTMCGHGIIGLAKVGLDTGLIELPGSDPVVRMDTPAGRVTACAHREGATVTAVSFDNVPSFVFAQNEVVTVAGVGEVSYDVAYGGAFYAYCDAEALGLSLVPAEQETLINLGRCIKKAVMDSLPITHPFAPDLGFLYGVIFVGPPHEQGNHSRNVCIFADGEVDRCPTGTGVSARAALHYARGELALNEPFAVESILGTIFTGQVIETTRFGPHDAVIPRITGSAHITGRSECLLDPADPLSVGFLVPKRLSN